MAETTERLVEAVSRGERTALGLLVLEFDPLLRAVVESHLREAYRRDGEDFLQHVRAVIVEKISTVRHWEKAALRAWIERVASNAVRDLERRRAAARRKPTGALVSLQSTSPPSVAASGPSPSTIVSSQEELEQLRAAIAAVPERYRPVLELLVEQDPTPSEVADFLGKEPEAARKFVARALTHLRRTI